MKTDHKEKDLFLKLCRYCAYRERAKSEVIEKMNSLDIKPTLQKEFIIKLEDENFLNETRYAASYARGKFRNNHWGRLKIIQGLRQKGIAGFLIEKGLSEIDYDDYMTTVEKLILAKIKKYKEKDAFKLKQKIAAFLYNKGYESNVIWECLHKLLPNK